VQKGKHTDGNDQGIPEEERVALMSKKEETSERNQPTYGIWAARFEGRKRTSWWRQGKNAGGKKNREEAKKHGGRENVCLRKRKHGSLRIKMRLRGRTPENSGDGSKNSHRLSGL